MLPFECVPMMYLDFSKVRPSTEIGPWAQLVPGEIQLIQFVRGEAIKAILRGDFIEIHAMKRIEFGERQLAASHPFHRWLIAVPPVACELIPIGCRNAILRGELACDLGYATAPIDNGPENIEYECLHVTGHNNHLPQINRLKK